MTFFLLKPRHKKVLYIRNNKPILIRFGKQILKKYIQTYMIKVKFSSANKLIKSPPNMEEFSQCGICMKAHGEGHHYHANRMLPC